MRRQERKRGAMVTGESWERPMVLMGQQATAL